MVDGLESVGGWIRNLIEKGAHLPDRESNTLDGHGYTNSN